MYTVEFEHDASIVTSMDEKNKYEDVEVILTDNGTVYIRQFENELDQHQLVVMSYQQLLDIITSLQQTEGMYQLVTRKAFR